MADITVRKENQGPSTSMTPAPAREPLRSLRDLFRFDPFRELAAWDPFTEMAPLLQRTPASFWPAFEVKETASAYLFKADLPGVKESDLQVVMTGNRLTISGSRHEEKEEESETYYTCERQYGTFNRSYTLPEGVDAEHIHAALTGGVLTVAVPKRPEAQPRKIPVKAAAVKA